MCCKLSCIYFQFPNAMFYLFFNLPKITKILYFVLFYRFDIMQSCWAEDQYRRPSFKLLTTSLEKMLEKENDYLQLDFKQFVNNMCYFMDGIVIIY